MTRFPELRCALVLFLLMAGLFSCGSDPERQKVWLLELGNEYHDTGKHHIASIIYRKALQIDRRYGEAHYRLALSHLAQNDLLAAAGAFWRAYELQDSGYDAFRPLTRIYLQFYLAADGRATRLISELTYLTEMERARDPDSIEVVRVEAAVALADGRFDEAVEKYDAVLDAHPGELEATLSLSNALVGANSYTRAEKLAVDLLESEPRALALYDSLYRVYASQGRWKDAERIRLRAVEQMPEDLDPRIGLAAHYSHTDQRALMESTLEEALSGADDALQSYLTVGAFYVRLREVEKGIEIYTRGLRSDPSNARRYQDGILEALILSGERTRAGRLLDEVLEKNPRDVAALTLRASIHRTSKYQKARQLAIGDLVSALELQPKNALIRFSLGETYLREGDSFNAKLQFSEALKREPAFLLPKLALANIHLVDYDFVRAKVLAEEVLAIHPGHVGARLLLADAWIGLREFDEAREALDTILERQPNEVEALNTLARVNLLERRYGEALRTYSRIRRRAPDDSRALEGLVRTLMAQGRLTEARELVRSELRTNPSDTALRMALGRISSELKEFESALNEFQAVSRQEPDNNRVHALLGETYIQLSRLESAEQSLRQAIRLDPQYAHPYVMLGTLHMAAGRNRDAVRVFEQALGLDPDSVVALNNLAFILVESGKDLDRALSLAQRAKALEPNHPGVADTLGWAYLKRNLPTEAIPIFRRLVTHSPDRARWRYSLARALFEVGAREAARMEMEAALRCNPTASERADIEQLREQLES